MSKLKKKSSIAGRKSSSSAPITSSSESASASSAPRVNHINGGASDVALPEASTSTQRLPNRTVSPPEGAGSSQTHENDAASSRQRPRVRPQVQHQFKVILIGDAGVGKTLIRQRWLSDAFTLGYRATIGVDFMTKQVEIEPGYRVGLSVWDTAGQDRFKSLASSFFRGSDACVLVYSDRQSLHSLKSWFEEFKLKAPVEQVEHFTWIAIRSKVDLEEGYTEQGSGFSQGEEEKFLRELLGLKVAIVRDGGGTDEEELEHVVGYTTGDEPTIPTDTIERSNTSKTTRSRTVSKSTIADGEAACCSDMPTQIQVGSSSNSSRRKQNACMLSNGTTTSSTSQPGKQSGSTMTIYHTPSSSLYEPLDRLRNGEDTTKGSLNDRLVNTTAVPKKGSKSAPVRTASYATNASIFLEEVSEEEGSIVADGRHDHHLQYSEGHLAEEAIDYAELERELARGIDPFMATSPPHPPSHLITVGKHLGGPSIFQKVEKERLIDLERKRNERKMDTIPGAVASTTSASISIGVGNSQRGLGPNGYGRIPTSFEGDGIKLFRTSAKTGEGVHDVFGYIARRTTWQYNQDEERRKNEFELDGGGKGGGIVKLGPDQSSHVGKWREACCS